MQHVAAQLTETQVARLARIARYDTRHEITLSNGTDAYLVAYTARRSQAGLTACVFDAERAPAIARITGATDATKTKTGWALGGWTIQFSGRTQRDAIMSGEHKFILD